MGRLEGKVAIVTGGVASHVHCDVSELAQVEAAVAYGRVGIRVSAISPSPAKSPRPLPARIS